MMMPVDTLEIKSKIRRLWHRQRDRYATPRCVRVKTSGKGVQPFLLAIAGFRRRQRGKGWSLTRSRSP